MQGNKNPNYRHGGNVEHKPEYNSWRAMKERCGNRNYWAYHHYGGRGITVCERWLGRDGFRNFLSDLGKKPTPKHSIDRIDRDGHYTPDNCKWSNQRQQMSHTSRNRFVVIDGESKTMTEWCRAYGKTMSQVYNRLGDGWDIERALKTPQNSNGVNFC